MRFLSYMQDLVFHLPPPEFPSQAPLQSTTSAEEDGGSWHHPTSCYWYVHGVSCVASVLGIAALEAATVVQGTWPCLAKLPLLWPLRSSGNPADCHDHLELTVGDPNQG